MRSYLRSIASPMLSMFILVIGSGFLMTLVPVRSGLEGFPPEIAGYLAAAYFAGMLIGAIRISTIIEGVGHIRAFAFFASALAIIVLLQGLFVNPWFWIGLRLLFGLGIAGIFIIIESWLLVKSSPKSRGIALSIYMTIFYLAQSMGQLFLGFFETQSLIPFCFIAMLTSLSVLPLTITKTKAPISDEHSILSPIKLLKVAPLAVISALFSGLILGPIYGLLPVYAQEVNFTQSQISWIMGSVIIGGLFFQWPLGAISDKVDRRKVLFFASGAAATLALLAFILPQMPVSKFLGFTALFGGFCFVLYPMSISMACDQVDAKDIIAATGAVLLSYGLGSIVGPIAASYGMRIFGPTALFAFIFGVAGVLALVTFTRIIAKEKMPDEEKLPYSNFPQTTPIAAELDPRVEEATEREAESQD